MLVYILIEHIIKVLVAEIHVDKISYIALLPCTPSKKRKQELAWMLKISNHVKENIETFNDVVKTNDLSHITNFF